LYERVDAAIRFARMFMTPSQKLRLAIKLQEWGKELEFDVVSSGKVPPAEAAVIRAEELGV
jgi:hypothetical protein